MAHLLSFSRNRCTTVEQVAPDALRSTCRLQDNLLDARVTIEVRQPELEICSLQWQVHLAARQPPADLPARLNKVIGVRVGPGMLKILKGLVGEEPGYLEAGFMLEEACQAVILSLTKTELQKAPLEPADSREHFAAVVKKNIRLYNRCAAFAAGSSLVEGIETPET